ncbi:MAG: DUF3487 family protein [Candidatus Thiodiazotropha sp.]
MAVQEDTAHLIDTEPVLFLGCSSSEILTLAGLGFVIGLMIGGLIALFVGIWLLVLPFLILIPVIAIYYGGKRLGKAKEGKPNGYFDRLIAHRLNMIGLRNALVVRAGYWRNTR